MAGLLLPGVLAVFALRILGHRVHATVRIGFSLVLADVLVLGEGVRIGHGNWIQCRRLVMRPSAYIQHFNIVQGPLSVRMSRRAAIGNRNVVKRAWRPVSYGPAVLGLGELAKITVGHRVDCMRSVVLGDFTTVAGEGSQLWTHGYIHEASGAGRFRVDGSIRVGHNVYIGSACVISMGVRIADGIVVGSLSSVARSLEEPGLYVSQPLRCIPLDRDAMRARLSRVSADVCEEVHEKPA